MAQSQNSSVDLAIKATSFQGLTTYGDVMVGNAAFEFYNERNPEDYIQIPWDQVDYVAAEVLPGKKIARFANKATLRAMRAYVPEDRLQRSPSFADVMKAGAKSLLHLGRK